MSDVWKIVENYSASEFYQNSYKIMTGHQFFNVNNLRHLQDITNVCQKMSESFEEIIEEQIEYQIEISEYDDDILNIDTIMQNEINQIQKEINEILAKSENGELSEEDKNRLSELYGQIEAITGEANKNIDNLNSNIQTTVQKSSSLTSKANIAYNYANFTIEKGNEYTKIEEEFKEKNPDITNEKAIQMHMRLLGVLSKVNAGKNAVKVGENLVEKTDEAVKINRNITNRSSI